MREHTDIRKQLADAVEFQKVMACQSVNILAPLTELIEDDDSFYFEHIPASSINTTALFDPASDPTDTDTLLNASTCLLDALATAHNPPAGRPIVHGGICPGVVMFDDDNNPLLTDFGWAQAISKTISSQAYLNLAVGFDPERQAVVWRIRDTDDARHDDRLCGFLDPQKYGNRQITTFEQSSDVIAAAFVLHLLAERRHPYFPDHPHAHRLVATSEFLGMFAYDNRRRDDLANDVDPRTRAWCDTIAQCLERFPRNRPSATEARDALVASGITITEPVARLAAMIDAIANADAHLVWPLADTVARHDHADESVITAAEERRQSAEPDYLLRRAADLLETEDWSRARTPIEAILNTDDAPPDTRAAAEARNIELANSFELSAAIAQFKKDIQKFDDRDPVAIVGFLDGLLAELDTLADKQPAAAHVVDQLRELHEDVAFTLESMAEFAEQLQQEKDADARTALDWLASITDAVNANEFSNAESLLADQPEIRHWPDNAIEQRDTLRRQVDEFRTAERQQAAIDTDHAAAQQWFENLTSAAPAEDWPAAAAITREKPTLTYWPETLQPQIDELEQTIAEQVRRIDEHEHAREWSARVVAAVDAEDWTAAVDIFAQRPVLEYWPEDVIEQEEAFKPVIAENQEAIELDRRITVEHHRQANEWLDKAENLCEQKQWEPLRELLNHPPKIDRWPDGVKDRASELETTCQIELTDHLLRQLGERTRAVTLLAERFVRECARESFAKYVDPSLIAVSIENELFTSTIEGADGHANMIVKLEPAESELVEVMSANFDFALNVDSPHVFDESNRLRQAIRSALGSALLKLQQHRPINAEQRLRQGLFPDARVQFATPEQTEKSQAQMILVASESAPLTLDVALVWHPGELRWVFADRTRVQRRLCDIVADSVLQPVRDQLLDIAPTFKAYDDILRIDAAPPATFNDWQFNESVTLAARLSIRADGKTESADVFAFPMNVETLGTVDLSTELIDAESKLQSVIVEMQKTSQQQIAQELATRLTKGSVKPNVTATPAVISEPTDEIAFRIDLKHRKPLQLTAKWQPASLAYQLAEGWRDEISRLSGPPSASERVRAALVPAIVGLIAVVALGGGGYYYYINRPAPPPTQDGGPIARTIDPQESLNRDFASLIDETRNTVTAIGLIADAADRIVPDQSTPASADPIIAYSVAGLENPEGTIRLEHDTRTDKWALRTDDVAALAAKLNALERIMTASIADQLDDIARTAVTGELASFVTPLNIRATMQPVDWTLGNDNATWSADVAATINVADTPAGTDAFQAPFTIRDGIADPGGASASLIASTVRTIVTDELIARQQDAHRAWMDQLDVAALPPNPSVTPPSDAPSLRTQVDATITVAPLQPRTFTAQWEPASLSYQGNTPWPVVVERIGQATQLLALVNNELPADHWLSTGLGGRRIVETAPPTGTILNCITAAPWVPDPQTPPQVLDEGDQLALLFDLANVYRASAENPDITKLAKPQYWPLIERYFELVAAPTPLTSLSPGELSGITSSGDAGQRVANVIAQFQQPNRIAIPAARVIGEPGFQAQPIPRLDLPSELTWIPSPNASGENINTNVILAAITEASPVARVTRSITLSPTSGIDATWTNLPQLANTLEDVMPRIDALDERITSMGDRKPLEDELNNTLGQSDTLDLSGDQAQAMQWLKRIWSVKGATLDVNDFSSLSRGLRRQLVNRGMTVDPTIFGEYFTGDTTTFAIVWSAGLERNVPIKEGPILLRLIGNGEPRADNQGLSRNSIDMGRALVGQLIDAVQNAVVAFEYQESVSALLGADDRLLLVDLANLRFTDGEKKSVIRSLEASRGTGRLSKRWNSLAQLSPSDGFRWEHRLVTSLASAGTVWQPINPNAQDDPRRWALEVLENARTGQ